MDAFLSRVVRAIRLDPALYEEVEADAGATVQALGVIVLSSVAAGLVSVGGAGAGSMLADSLIALVGWFFWALVTYLIGTKIMPAPATRSDLGELLRVTGFAAAPGLLRPIGAIPGLFWPVFVVTGVWMLVAMIVAIRQALDYSSTLRAFFVAVIGWLLFFCFGALLGGFSETVR